jgi:hypothetical protein
MPLSEMTPVKKLKLDLTNYRTTKQEGERHAVEAIIAINPDWFWALADSLLQTGYLPTENVLVLKGNGLRPSLVVKEGNRRIAALKLIHGLIPLTGLPVPKNIVAAIESLPLSWKRSNSKVPCTIYEPEEEEIVNRIRSLTHGKGEKAGRDPWTAVARARHNRDEKGETEPALDLLEKYLECGKNHTEQQAQRWAGDFPLSVLQEALKKRLPARLGASNSPDLVSQYPDIRYRTELENIIRDVGLHQIRFETLRNKDVATEYGIPLLPSKPTSSGSKSTPGVTGSQVVAQGTNAKPEPNGALGTAGIAGVKGTTPDASGAAAPTSTGGKKIKAVAISDPKQVARTLKGFSPKGANREKVVSLLLEIRNLKLNYNPIAFCFLLRSMFEISAKAYCVDHKGDGLSAVKDGNDRKLVEVLRDITKHLTNNSQDREAQKILHGAMTEIAKPEGILSVTSMNALVHNPRFSHQPSDIAILFGNIFPLLEAMNN